MTEPTTCLACGHDDPHDVGSGNKCRRIVNGNPCRCSFDKRTIAALRADVERLKDPERLGRRAATIRVNLLRAGRNDDEEALLQFLADAALGANLRRLVATCRELTITTAHQMDVRLPHVYVHANGWDMTTVTDGSADTLDAALSEAL